MSRQTRPNIVFALCDNIGWGDFSCYGGSTPPPRIDKLASEEIHFNNHTVGAQCTPTRSALLTGRQAVRSGTFKVPYPGEGKSGLIPWEYTIAELLSDAGLRDVAMGQVASGGDASFMGNVSLRMPVSMINAQCKEKPNYENRR
jgi:arylsulfatase A-like enzyme